MRSSSLFSLSACNRVNAFTMQPLHSMLHREAPEYALYRNQDRGKASQHEGTSMLEEAPAVAF